MNTRNKIIIQIIMITLIQNLKKKKVGDEWVYVVQYNIKKN